MPEETLEQVRLRKAKRSTETASAFLQDAMESDSVEQMNNNLRLAITWANTARDILAGER